MAQELTVDPAERREHARHNLGLAAAVTWPVSAPCVIADVAVMGACLATDYASCLPPEFHLKLNLDLMRKCRIVWRTKTKVGVKFLPNPRSRLAA